MEVQQNSSLCKYKFESYKDYNKREQLSIKE